MTTTAHEDQFTAEPEPVRQPYDTGSILRRNVADLEIALKQQTERAEAAEEKLTTAREDMQSWIDSRNGWMERAGAAEAELAKLRKQKPVAMISKNDAGQISIKNPDGSFFDISKNVGCQFYAVPVTASAVSDEWREVMAELAADLQACIEAEHAYRDQYSSVMRKYQNDMRIVERARALLQSTGGKK